MAAIAARAALRDAGVGWQDVDFAAGGSDAAGNADTTVSVLGLTGVPFINVKNGCATGGSALATAHAMLAAGAAEIALVVGFDKHPPGAFNPLPEEWGLGSWYGETGLMLTTQFFAMKIQRYMAEHGISESTLAKVASKAFENGARNPNAWRRRPLSEDEVLGSKMVNHPLTQYMFCSPGEGAVALVLARGERARTLGRARRSACARSPSARAASAPSRSSARRSRSSRRPSPTTEAAAAAFEQAGIGPEDVDVAQLQDTESGAEVMHLAETGLCEHGEQEALIQSGATRLDGRLPVNTDGGCLANGEPIGASGLRQVHEVVAPAARRGRRPPGRRAAARRLHAGLRRARRQRLHRAQPLSGREVQLASYPTASRGRATSASSRFRSAGPGPERSWCATPGRRWIPG